MTGNHNTHGSAGGSPSVLRESALHGDIFLPINNYHCLIPESYTQLAPHWHEEMEVTLIREGASVYRIYTEQYEVHADDILIIPPYCIHSASEISGRTMISDSLVFHPDFLGASGQDLSATKYLRPIAKGQFRSVSVLHPGDDGYAEIKASFTESLENFIAQNEFYELKLRQSLLALVIHLLEFHYLFPSVETETELSNRRQLASLLEYMNCHYREKMSVAGLSERIGFSESYFMYYFKKHVGMTCNEYLNHYRIQRAAEALSSSGDTVLSIAMDNGFENISYFNRRFSKQFGMTPGQFRKRLS